MIMGNINIHKQEQTIPLEVDKNWTKVGRHWSAHSSILCTMKVNALENKKVIMLATKYAKEI